MGKRQQQDDKLSEVFSKINLEEVAENIIGVNEEDIKLQHKHDFEDAKRLVLLGAEKYLLRDLEDLYNLKVEEYLVSDFYKFRGRIDMVARMKGEVKYEYKDSEGAPQLKDQDIIVDWKTSRNTLGSDWKQRLIDSWQWRLYGMLCKDHGYTPRIFSYRGLSRNGDVTEVCLEITPQVIAAAINHVKQCLITRDSLYFNRYLPWPQHKPRSCRLFDRECPHLPICNGEEPLPNKDFPILKPFSYSSLESFMDCPEKYRLNTISENTEDTEDTIFGQAVHRGLENLWKQAFNI